MANPTASAVHVNRPLTDLSVAFLQDARWSVADKVFPMVASSQQSNLYYEWSRADMLRIEAQTRAPCTESAGMGLGLSTRPFYCHVDAVHFDICDQIRANQDEAVDLEMTAARSVTEQLLKRRDKRWAEAYFNAAAWPNYPTFTPSPLWGDAAATPIADIRSQMDLVFQNTGMMPNKLVVGAEVASALKDSPDVLDRIRYTQLGVGSLDLVAQAAGLDAVIEARLVENTAAAGATPAYEYIVGSKDALLVYAAPAPGLMVPSAGYTFYWAGYSGAQNMGMRMKTFRIEEREAERVEGSLATAMNVVSEDLGVFFLGCVA